MTEQRIAEWLRERDPELMSGPSGLDIYGLMILRHGKRNGGAKKVTDPGIIAALDRLAASNPSLAVHCFLVRDEADVPDMRTISADFRDDGVWYASYWEVPNDVFMKYRSLAGVGA